MLKIYTYRFEEFSHEPDEMLVVVEETLKMADELAYKFAKERGYEIKRGANEYKIKKGLII